MVEAMIDSISRSLALRRLTLGSGTHESIRAALVERLAQLARQKDIAFSTDFDYDA